MDGIIPLINQVPERAPTNSNIIIAPVTDFKLSETLLIITEKLSPLILPKKIPTNPPINKINWFDQFIKWPILAYWSLALTSLWFWIKKI